MAGLFWMMMDYAPELPVKNDVSGLQVLQGYG